MADDYKRRLFFPLCCLSFTAFFALTSIMAGFGTRWGWWGFRTGLAFLRWSTFAEAAMATLSLLGSFLPRTRKSGKALALFVISFVISLASVSVPVRMWLAVRSVPMIHDITTDTENPPQFDTIMKFRKDALNPVAYGGRLIAEQQRQAYPDITPLILPLPPGQAFERSLAAAKKLCWEIVSVSRDKGLIEATDTTFWFGFKDDIVIRISPQGIDSRIDLRSLSRVGKSDAGTNAKRIRAFFKEVQKK